VGRHDEARAVAHKYMQNVADMEDVEHEDDVKGRFGMLFSRDYWRATLFMSVFWFCAVAPYFAIATFADSPTACSSSTACPVGSPVGSGSPQLLWPESCSRSR
jgi:hypothetical protein